MDRIGRSISPDSWYHTAVEAVAVVRAAGACLMPGREARLSSEEARANRDDRRMWPAATPDDRKRPTARPFRREVRIRARAPPRTRGPDVSWTGGTRASTERATHPVR